METISLDKKAAVDNSIEEIDKTNTIYLQENAILRDRYKILRVIGVGGFGITYKAYDKVLASEVAIKEYYPMGLANRTPDRSDITLYTETQRVEFGYGKVRFLKEAQDLAKFNKNNGVVSVYDFFEENNTAYMVMEYLEGCTLKEYLNSTSKIIEEDMMIQVTFSVMEALEAIHNAGLIHRDISPDNIFLCNDSCVKLIDFGAVKQEMKGDAQTVSVVLKYGYAPIEQYAKKSELGPWTDIYALGATMYRMVTGENPEEATSRVVDDTMKSPKEINPSVPDYINDVIVKAMAVRYTDRYTNIVEMRDSLINQQKHILVIDPEDKKNKPTCVEKKRKNKKQRKKGKMPVVLAFILFCVIALVALINNKTKNRNDSNAIANETTTVTTTVNTAVTGSSIVSNATIDVDSTEEMDSHISQVINETLVEQEEIQNTISEKDEIITESNSQSQTSESIKESNDVEQTKIQYRYRVKETTTSKNKTMDGWTQTNMEITSYTGWSDNKVSNDKPIESDILQIVSEKSETTYTYYHYDNVYKDGQYGIDSVGSGGDIKKSISYHSYVTTTPLFPVNYIDAGGAQAYGSSPCEYNWNYWFLGSSETITTYIYQTREPIYTYYYERWGAWSEWSNEPYAGNDNVQVETREVN